MTDTETVFDGFTLLGDDEEYERYGIHDVTDLDWIYTIRFFEYATGLKGERIEGWNEKILE